MKEVVRLLHITDTHMRTGGGPFERDDYKVDIGLEPQTRERALAETFLRVSQSLADEGKRLDGVIFCGDAQVAGGPGGHRLLYDLLLQHFTSVGVTPQKILAVPGNHDVPLGAPPSSEQRYRDFLDVWRAEGCITPWLDGVDSSAPEWRKHMLLSEQRDWVVVAVNSCNWSHVKAVPEDLKDVWEQLPAGVANGNAQKRDAVRKALQKLATYDVARISEHQLEVIRTMLAQLPTTPVNQLRMFAVHHHLRAPSLREEVKPFADYTNPELIRTFLREQAFSVVLHGHKHEANARVEYVHIDSVTPPHRLFTVSGATFDKGKEGDAMRLLEMRNLPYAPSMSVTAYPLARKGVNLSEGAASTHRLWSPSEPIAHAPTVVQGSNFDEVYARVQEVAGEEARRGTLIVHLDISDFEAVRRLPAGYPLVADEGERRKWLHDLVQWWQLERSNMEKRIGYVHGARLHKFAGVIDQVDRIGLLLKKGTTTRAIATLIDPVRDFRDDSLAKNPPQSKLPDFASFCLVQLSRRESGGVSYVDCVAYYRAQEMVRWWPINVAELLGLQEKIGKYFNGKPGRITTITASARSSSRTPTHVAMPVVDRWLDQAPEKLFLLASSLTYGSQVSEEEKLVRREWLGALSDLRTSALDSSMDGGPVVAIDGPRMLSRYLKAAVGPNEAACRKLAAKLGDLAGRGEQVAKLSKPSEYDEWGTVTAALLEEISEMSEALWRSEAQPG